MPKITCREGCHRWNSIRGYWEVRCKGRWLHTYPGVFLYCYDSDQLLGPDECIKNMVEVGEKEREALEAGAVALNFAASVAQEPRKSQHYQQRDLLLELAQRGAPE